MISLFFHYQAGIYTHASTLLMERDLSIYARHLGMLAKTGLITHEYVATHLYGPAAEENITYDDKNNDN